MEVSNANTFVRRAQANAQYASCNAVKLECRAYILGSPGALLHRH